MRTGSISSARRRLTRAQWTLDLAFCGLREGLSLATKERAQWKGLAESSKLLDDAYGHYVAGRRKDGFMALDRFHKLLKA